MKTKYEFTNIKLYENKIWQAYLEGLSVGVFDIETTGLNPLYSKVVLGGAFELKEDPSMWQFFAEAGVEEADLLKAYLDALAGFDVLISYNGDNFDLPFLQERLRKHGLEYDFSRYWSLDLYRIINKYSGLRKALPDLKQKTIEKYLGISDDRKDEISGGESVALYKEYLKNPDPVLKEKILLHNKDDLLQLASIVAISGKLDLHRAFFYEGFAIAHENKRFINREIKMKKGQLEIKAKGVNIGGDFYAFKPDYQGVFKDGELFLTIATDQIKGAEIFDLLALSEDFSSLKKLAAYEQGYLILQNQDQLNYHEINRLVGLIETQLLKELA